MNRSTTVASAVFVALGASIALAGEPKAPAAPAPPGSPTSVQCQVRVIGACAVGSAIREINADGTVVCETHVEQIVASEPLRIVRGTVIGDGTIERGTGFAVVKNATPAGSFTFTMTPTFSDWPATTVTPVCTQANRDCKVCGIAAQGFGPNQPITITFCKQDGTPVDVVAFHFHTIGPQ